LIYILLLAINIIIVLLIDKCSHSRSKESNRKLKIYKEIHQNYFMLNLQM